MSNLEIKSDSNTPINLLNDYSTNIELNDVNNSLNNSIYSPDKKNMLYSKSMIKQIITTDKYQTIYTNYFSPNKTSNNTNINNKKLKYDKNNANTDITVLDNNENLIELDSSLYDTSLDSLKNEKKSIINNNCNSNSKSYIIENNVDDAEKEFRKQVFEMCGRDTIYKGKTIHLWYYKGYPRLVIGPHCNY